MWIGLAVGVLTSCALPNQSMHQSMDRPPTAKEIAKWSEKNGLTAASETEIAESKKREARFVEGRAMDSNGRLKVTFRCGSRVGGGNSNLSTTSLYVLQDAKGRELASGPACLTKGGSAMQQAWFSPDGKQAVVFELLHECNGPPPFAILFYEDSGFWYTKFLAMPDFLNMPFDEGNHSECRGFLGDELLIDATTSGTIFKKKISELKDGYPFPFTVG
jgi:hypothetical protein